MFAWCMFCWTGIQTFKSLGKTSVGCPLTTNNLELSFFRLLSRSSRASSRNLHTDTHKGNVISKKYDIPTSQQDVQLWWHWLFFSTEIGPFQSITCFSYNPHSPGDFLLKLTDSGILLLWGKMLTPAPQPTISNCDLRLWSLCECFSKLQKQHNKKLVKFTRFDKLLHLIVHL